MKASVIASYATGAVMASAVWTTGVVLAPGSPAWWLLVAGWTGPEAIAGLSLLLIGMTPSPYDAARDPQQRVRPAKPARPAVTAGRR